MSWSRWTAWALVLGVLVFGAPGVRAGEEEAPSLPTLLVQAGSGERVQEIENRYAGRLQQLDIQIQSARLQLAQQLRGPQPDRARVRASMDRMLDLERERQHLLLDKVFSTLEVLREDERGKYLRRIVEQMVP